MKRSIARSQEEAQNGDLIGLRKRALYTKLGAQQTEDMLTHARAGRVLLLALEVADDVLVGYSSQSFLLGEQIAQWIDEVAAEQSI